ncbi:conserved repeat domain-containing protein/gliding motility-associated C-terminal domain-containing protein [Filimonas lacunae]|uniref:Conserved repeat domain-containing protein/gliding motility-associated C-terminal domain-containing protein n=2 Tax=Filimonas lacunae TaxID=477680 RepID=A0A173MKY2_9BACT|nr:CHU large protein [Filimonas lacunae]SIT09711.1 conserved repeat domain-containing protein/gliding motility-associated C-terminal domain-containing protein [Filimonas lacunae]
MYGCAAKAVAQLTPHVYTKYIHQGEWVTLTATATNATLYQWYWNGQPVTGATTTTYVANQAGEYTIQAFNGTDCGSDISDPIRIAIIADRGPVANTDLAVSKQADSKPVVMNQPYNYYITILNNGPVSASGIVVTDVLPAPLTLSGALTADDGTATYDAGSRTIEWKIPQLTVNQSSRLTYTVTAKDKGQVENIATVTATTPDSVQDNNRASYTKEIFGLMIPNTITPNGDGNNDQFIVSGLASYTDNEMIIINRWGNHVFEQKRYQNNWKGDGLNEGTYFYLLRIKDNSGKWQEFKGYITLLRPK